MRLRLGVWWFWWGRLGDSGDGGDVTVGKQGPRLFHIRVRTVHVHSVCFGRTFPWELLVREKGFPGECSSRSDRMYANSRTPDIGKVWGPVSPQSHPGRTGVRRARLRGCRDLRLGAGMDETYRPGLIVLCLFFSF